jgi:hypothetical protein
MKTHFPAEMLDRWTRFPALVKPSSNTTDELTSEGHGFQALSFRFETQSVWRLITLLLGIFCFTSTPTVENHLLTYDGNCPAYKGLGVRVVFNRYVL